MGRDRAASRDPRIAPQAYVSEFDSLIIRTTRFPEEVFDGGNVRLKIIARYGVGYENIPNYIDEPFNGLAGVPSGAG